MRLDEVDSGGGIARPIIVAEARLMALSLKMKNVWYGFVVTYVEKAIIIPGDIVDVRVTFLNDIGARDAFPQRASILIGDGVCSRGVIVLK